jgi:hypothetical protein
MINITTESHLGRKGLIWLNRPGHSPSLREAKAGTQTGRSLVTGAEAETTEECCLLTCSCWLAQPAFLLYNCPGVARTALSISAPHTGIGSLTSVANKGPQVCPQARIMEAFSQPWSPLHGRRFKTKPNQAVITNPTMASFTIGHNMWET